MSNDASQTIDLLKLRFMNDYLYHNHIYSEGHSQFHRELTTKMVKDYVDPLNLPKDAHILDMGAGPGYFCDDMKERGYTNYTAVTLGDEDIKMCTDKGHRVGKYDISFLPAKDGYIDESVDFIFCRHALEHSPYPIFTLMEYNRVLKQGGKLYIEVPAPDCDRRHEFNANHYSILGASQLAALLQRSGFAIDAFNNFEFDLQLGNTDSEGKPVTSREKYYCIMATKKVSLDLK